MPFCPEDDCWGNLPSTCPLSDVNRACWEVLFSPGDDHLFPSRLSDSWFSPMIDIGHCCGIMLLHPAGWSWRKGHLILLFWAPISWWWALLPWSDQVSWTVWGWKTPPQLVRLASLLTLQEGGSKAYPICNAGLVIHLAREFLAWLQRSIGKSGDESVQSQKKVVLEGPWVHSFKWGNPETKDTW